MIGASRHSRGAFTLLELMIAMAIVAILALSLVAELHVGFKTREVTEASMETGRTAALVMEVIRNDLLSAVPPSRGTFEQAFEGTQNPQGDGNDDLVFYTTSPASMHMVGGVSVGNGDIKEIELTAYTPQGRTDTILVRRTWNNLLAPTQENPDEEVLCRNVQSLTLQYYDGNGLAWMPTWDSTTATPVNTLPTAVMVTLTLKSPVKNKDGSQPVVYYTRVFQLPCIGASNNSTTTSTPPAGSSTGGTP
jgi:type II secretion system protein J